MDLINMQDCVIYCRKSSEDKSKQVQSIDDQLIECKRIVENNGLNLVTTPFVEAKSGWESEARIEFYRMLNFIEKHDTKIIVTWNLDRIGRNGKENGAVRDLISRGKLRIVTPTTIYDENNTLQSGFENLINEEFSNKLSKVVKARLKLKAERGEYPGNAPIGYFNSPEMLKGTRIVKPDENKWNLCRKWWEMMLTGLYTIPQSLEKINSMGLTGKYGDPVSRTVAFRFFRDIFYTGNFVYSGTSYPGIHKPMITMTEYMKVQRLIDSKNAKGPNTSDNPMPFLGIFKCPCGASITAERHTKHYKNGTSQVFEHYRCTRKMGPCNQKYLNAKYLEPQIKAYISKMELNPLFAEYFRKVMKRRNHEEFSYSRKQTELVSKQLVEIYNKKEAVYGMKNDGLIDMETFEAKKRELLIRERLLREQQSIKHTAYWEAVFLNALNFATEVSTIFDNGDSYIRGMVLKILGSDLTIEDQKLKIVPKNAFLFFREMQADVSTQNLWLEPKNMPKISLNEVFVSQKSRVVPRAGLGPA